MQNSLQTINYIKLLLPRIISLVVLLKVSSSGILKEKAMNRSIAIGGVMMSQVILYKSMLPLYGIATIGTSLCLILGYYLPLLFLSAIEQDWISFLTLFFVLPLSVAIISYYIGWRLKKQTIQYNAPEWNFEPFQMTIEETKRLPREYNRKYARLVANSHFCIFFIPIVFILLTIALPLYSIYEDVHLIQFIPFMNLGSLALLFVIALFGAFRATSNSASADFTLPLIREAVKLAEMQSKVTGVNHIRVILDKAKVDDFEIYSSPRVVLRIKGLEKDAYIESWSEDLRAITQVLCRLYEQGDHPQVVWWWFSTDRNFRKFVHPDENGYYVKYPILRYGNRLGVKDVTLVTQNAIALVLREYLKTHGEVKQLQELLDSLKAENN
jgi:hypothetical protein